jgi:hypothetical protein
VISPVVVAAAVGLALFWRRYPAEALVCAAVTAAFIVLNCGYFLPYGGFSPGPRFLVPALPFLAVGLGPIFARAPRATAVLAAVSIVATTARLLTWNNPRPPQQTLWGDIARIPYGVASTAVRDDLPQSWLHWLGVGRPAGAALIAAAALGAMLVGLRGLLHERAARFDGAQLALAAGMCLVLAADLAGIAGYPYDYRGTAPSTQALTPAPLRCSGGTARPRVEQGVLQQRTGTRSRALCARAVEAPYR